jgi:hypothetical protein
MKSKRKDNEASRLKRKRTTRREWTTLFPRILYEWRQQLRGDLEVEERERERERKTVALLPWSLHWDTTFFRRKGSICIRLLSNISFLVKAAFTNIEAISYLLYILSVSLPLQKRTLGLKRDSQMNDRSTWSLVILTPPVFILKEAEYYPEYHFSRDLWLKCQWRM